MLDDSFIFVSREAHHQEEDSEEDCAWECYFMTQNNEMEYIWTVLYREGNFDFLDFRPENLELWKNSSAGF